MGMKENDISNIVRYAWDKVGGLLFRNNCGFDHAKKVHYGLKKGSGDFIGPTPIVITQAMVGKKIGVFTSIEMKADTDATKEQDDWMTLIKSYGGIAFIARGDKRLPDPQAWEFPDA